VGVFEDFVAMLFAGAVLLAWFAWLVLLPSVGLLYLLGLLR